MPLLPDSESLNWMMSTKHAESNPLYRCIHFRDAYVELLPEQW